MQLEFPEADTNLRFGLNLTISTVTQVKIPFDLSNFYGSLLELNVG